MKARKTVEVDIPELADLPLDGPTAALLDKLATEARTITLQIGNLERAKKLVMDGDPEDDVPGLRQLAAALNLPDRVLGADWDLRRTTRVSERVNEARLKMLLMQAGLRLQVECPKTIVTVVGTIEVCNVCKGTGVKVLDGMFAANHLLKQCADRTESTSISVYARKKEGVSDAG
jgi:hypothetical protein